MKKIPVIFLALVVSLTSLTPAPGALQSAEESPTLFLMNDSLVDVSKAGEYEAGLKELLDLLRKQAFPVRFDTYVTDDSHYYLIYGLVGFAGVDRWLEAWDKAGRAEPRIRALRDRLASAELERAFRFWRFRTDISFLPENERLKPGEPEYYTWDYIWIIPGREAEFEALNREWAALSRAHNARDPFMTYSGELGLDTPVYAWFEYGKSAADYAAAEEEFWRSLGDAGAALSKRTRALIRRMETKTGRYRPDLSYAPR